MTYTEIAEIIGVSRERARLIEEIALRKVRARLTARGVDGSYLDGLAERQQGGVFG
jgi:DNA-directed RNA polymerase sigma subunit (sigma70/sigma32)